MFVLLVCLVFSVFVECRAGTRKAFGDGVGQGLTRTRRCPVMSCPVLSCPVLSCPVLFCPVLHCFALLCFALLCLLLSCSVHFSPSPLLPCRGLPYLTSKCFSRSCRSFYKQTGNQANKQCKSNQVSEKQDNYQQHQRARTGSAAGTREQGYDMTCVGT